MATILNLERLNELINYPERLKGGELPHVCQMASKQLQVDSDPNAIAKSHRREIELKEAALGTHMENLRQCAAKLADSDRLRKLAAMDLGASETHCQSLIRRLQEAVGKEHAIREWQAEFELSVNKCIECKELGPVASMNPTLLRLQEALDAKTESKNDA